LVQQQLSSDPRLRAWVWKNYPEWLTAYQTLWNTLVPLRSRFRYLNGDVTPYVYLKEDETHLMRTASVSGTTLTESYPFFRCRVLEVSRKVRSEPFSSRVVYEDTRLVFVIEDPDANDMG